MHDNTDDLLEELAELEEADLSPSPSLRPADTSPPPRQDVLLEATQQAQQAAELAQVAADRALALSKEQKENIIEISEALGAWRQASRSSLKALQSSHRKMSIMVGLSALLSVATLSGGGWLLWQIQKATEAAKADILDLLQTQLVVFQQKTTLKLDELAAVVESFQAELNRLAKSGLISGVTPAPAADQSTIPSTEATDSPVIPDLAQEAVHQFQPNAVASTNTPSTSPAHSTQGHPPSSAQENEQKTLPAAEITLKLTAIESALTQVQQQLKQLLAQQKTLQLPQPVRNISPAALADIRKMIAEQNRHLKIIRTSLWKLRQQQTSALSSSTRPDQLKRLEQAITSLTRQIQQLKSQQEKMRAELTALKQQTAKLAAEQPYSYRAPPLNLQ